MQENGNNGTSREFIEDFLTSPTEQRLLAVRNPANESVLRGFWGDKIYEEYRKMANLSGPDHLGGTDAVNLIFIPGIMGSLLSSQTLGGVWWIDCRTYKRIDSLRLSSDGKEDFDKGHDIRPCSTDPSYETFLAAVLRHEDFNHVIFPYDWRKSLLLCASSLRDRIVQVFQSNGNQKIHLVAHSMGGLLVRTTLMEYGDELWPKIDRIVFLGTPHYGSPAMAGNLKNHLGGSALMSLLGRLLSRESFRSLRGAIGLLPAPSGIYPGTRPGESSNCVGASPGDAYRHPCVNFDLYNVENWKLELTSEEAEHLQQVLGEAADLHRRLYDAHQQLSSEQRDRMLVIAGVGYKMLYRLAYTTRLFGGWETTERISSRILGDPHREGDGSVPLASACLEDVEIRYVKALHQGIPNVPVVYREVFRWLNGRGLVLPTSAAGALSDHLDEDYASETPHLDGSQQKLATETETDVWNCAPSDISLLNEMEAKLQDGQLPEFMTVRLL
jgi:pimeloyl-ACP methyl ester carboxylesterase